MFNQVYLGSKHDRRDIYTDSAIKRIMTNGQLSWFIQKGDILLPNTQIEAEKEFAFNFQEADDRSFKLPICEFPDDNMQGRSETAQEGKIETLLRTDANLLTYYQDLNEVAVLHCDLSKFPINKFDQSGTSRDGSPCYVAYCVCKFVLSGNSLSVEIIWDRKRMCNARIENIQRVTKSESRNILIILSPCEREYEGRDQPKRDERVGRLKVMSPDALCRLREHIRTRYQLDTEIWRLRKIRKADRGVVEEMMKRADMVLLEIYTIIKAWENTESSWTSDEWDQVMEIQQRILAEGKRWWADNPPWGVD
jgi:hypothetical protein